MLFFVVCENVNCDYVCHFDKKPLHGEIISGWSLKNPDLRHRVISEMGCYVKVKYAGAQWHPQFGELPKIELVRVEQNELALS